VCGLRLLHQRLVPHIVNNSDDPVRIISITSARRERSSERIPGREVPPCECTIDDCDACGVFAVINIKIPARNDPDSHRLEEAWCHVPNMAGSTFVEFR